MSGHIGLREESRAGHLLARRIARLFVVAASQPTKRTTGQSAAVGDALRGLDNDALERCDAGVYRGG